MKHLPCSIALVSIALLACSTAPPEPVAQVEPERGPRTQPGTEMGLYSPTQHDLYDGRFILSGTKIYQTGTLNDPSPWDHMGNDGSNTRPVGGSVEFDVDEINNSGAFTAELELPEGRYVITMDEVKEFSPCQDGGIAAWLFEHGDSGCGDANWPKSLLYVAGWGMGSATLDGKPLYENYELHFMVTQGMRDRNLVAHYPYQDKKSEAGAVNPALQQIDFYIRSPEKNEANHPRPRGLRPLLRDGSNLEIVADRGAAGFRRSRTEQPKLFDLSKDRSCGNFSHVIATSPAYAPPMTA